MGTTPTWLQEPAVLLKSPLDFFPSPGQTPPERANSMTRLCLYAGLVVGAYRGQVLAWVLGAAAVAVALTLAVGGRGGGSKYEDGVGDDISGPARAPGQGRCTMPTEVNPFANALVTDLGKASFPPACSLETAGVKDLQRSYFNRGLVRSIYDPWGRENSFRQWYTLPSPTGVADTTAVRNFLYGTSLNCKGSMRDCASKPTCKEVENGGGAVCTGFRP